MSYLAKGMMHQIQSFSLFVRKMTSHLVLAENQFSQHLFSQAWFYKLSNFNSKSEIFLSSYSYAIQFAWSTFQSSESNLTAHCYLLFIPALCLDHNTKPTQSRRRWPASHLLYFRNVSFAQFLLVVWAKTHVLGHTEPFSLRQLSYFNVHYYRKRTGSSVQPEHSSNLATELPRAMGVGSSLRCAWLRNPLPSKCKKLLSTRKGYTCSYFLKWQQPKLESKCMGTKVRGSM